MSTARAICVLGALSFSAPAAAQLSAGGGIAGYVLYAADGSGEWRGVVVAIPDFVTSLPKGFEAGREYWYFRPDKGQPDDFVLVSSYRSTGDCSVSGCDLLVDGIYVPSDASAYQVYDHEAFDLDDPVTFPKVSGASWAGGVYDVSDKVIDYGFSASTLDDPIAWFAFGSGIQQAWADTGAVDEERIAPVGSGAGLLFTAEALPVAGSVKVYEAR